MLRNYIKVAVRNLIRNKTYMFINVMGLSVAIGVCVVIYLNFRHTMDANTEHANYERIFKVNGRWMLNGDPEGVGITPLPLVTMAKADISQVKEAARYHIESTIIRRGDVVFSEEVAYVDDSFFDMFDFQLQEGSANAIKNPGQIIISKDMAIRYFGDETAIGKDIRILSKGEEFLYTVGSVLKRLPTNTSFSFKAAFISIENYFDHFPEIERNDWSQWVDGTFIQLHNAEDKEIVEQQLAAYLLQQIEANDHLPFDQFYLDRIDHWSHHEQDLRYGYFRNNMQPSAVWGLNSSAILILLLSCFNFMNTSISFSNKRLKEIGIRKVFGGVRSQLITQFLIENVILILAALVIGLVLAEMLIPAFNNLFYFVHLELNIINNANLVAFLLIMSLTVAAFSAIYPAVYVSSFEPVNIFQGNTKFGSGNRFLRILIAGQFIITVYNIFGGIVFYQNGQYQTTMDQGYDLNKSIVVHLNGESEFNNLKNELLQNPDITSIAGSKTQLAFNTAFAVIKREQEELEVGWMRIGHDYLQTMGIELKEGRDFERELDNSLSENVIVNEELTTDLGWNYSDEPIIGRRLHLDSAYYTVVGVVKNFHERVLFRGGDIRPVIITLTDPQDFGYLTARTENTNIKAVNSNIKETWEKVFPNAPYDGFYQSKAIELVSEVNFIIDRINITVTIISILLSSIGLYTLVSLNIIKRITTIRK